LVITFFEVLGCLKESPIAVLMAEVSSCNSREVHSCSLETRILYILNLWSLGMWFYIV